MNNVKFEQFLAQLYVDPALRERFLAEPLAEASRAGLSEEQCRALAAIDRVGLNMAARSFAHKRARKRPPASLWNRWRRRQDT
jgi:hypothetical protein